MKSFIDISLKPYNTFGVDVRAKKMIVITSIDDLLNADFDRTQGGYFILGGGSDVLFTRNFSGTILKNEITGYEVLEETDSDIVIRVGSGENWDSFVEYCVEKEYYGIENLSFIPGTVGAAPIQNIGAYGQEVSATIIGVNTLSLRTGEVSRIFNSDCKFDYRYSIFKNPENYHLFITSVEFRLKKNGFISAAYRDVKKIMEAKGITNPGIKEMRQMIGEIRKMKLPDPKDLGNAGSFFKNPVIPKSKFYELQKRFPDISYFQIDDKNVKLAAAWLIERCGYKGRRFGECGVHDKQALILVNYGNADGRDLLTLSLKIQHSVREKFGVELVPEVVIR